MNNIQNQPSFGMALYMPPKQKIVPFGYQTLKNHYLQILQNNAKD